MKTCDKCKQPIVEPGDEPRIGMAVSAYDADVAAAKAAGWRECIEALRERGAYLLIDLSLRNESDKYHRAADYLERLAKERGHG